MRTRSLRIATLLTLAVASLGSAAILATVRENAPAYPNSIRRVFEKPTFRAVKGEVVEVVRWGKPLTQVRNTNGRLGWLESASLDTVNIPAVLSITKSSAASSKLSPAEDSALAKRWLEAQKNTPSDMPAPQKSLDFPPDSTHITPRNVQDSAQ